MKLIFCFILSNVGLLIANAQQTNISGIINHYSKVEYIHTGECSSNLEVITTSGFNINDKILIVQMKGAVINTSDDNNFGTIISYENSGNYELATIKEITGTTIELNEKLLNNYSPESYVQIVRVPVYENANITSTLTAFPWNGHTGGILVLEVKDKLILNADINVDGLGFKGGEPSPNHFAGCSSLGYIYSNNSGHSGKKGEGIVDPITSMSAGRGALANGGGGGNHVNAGGGGGGNIGAGGRGGNEWRDCSQLPIGGEGGKSLTYSDKIFFGGGGGGPHVNNSAGSNGSNAGGIVVIIANTIQNNGYNIKANGSNVANTATIDGAGGAGAGGTILIKSNNFENQLGIEAKGGNGGNVNTYFHGPGGGGGGGLIWLSLSSVPVTLTTNLNGGSSGVLTSSSGSYGAAAGGEGTVLYDLIIPQNSIIKDCENECTDIKVPNAFSPNNDGLNDNYNIIYKEGLFQLENFMIFNRWGEKVFETNNINSGWDGTYKNNTADIGVYAYIIYYKCLGNTIIKKGNVTLLR